MRIIGCDLHARQQTLAMLDTVSGEVTNRTLLHEGNEVREFYSQLPRPVLVGIEAIGPMQWFLDLLEELRIESLVGDAAKIRAAEPRKQKHDRRDAKLILKLLVEKRFPAIWRASKELLDLRALLLHRHHWVRLRTQIQNALQAIALANGLRRGPGLWSYDGQAKIASLPLPPHASYRRSMLQALYRKMEEEIEQLSAQVAEQAKQRPVRGCLKSAMVRMVTVRLVRLPASLHSKRARISHHGPASPKRWLVGSTEAMKRHRSERKGEHANAKI